MQRRWKPILIGAAVVAVTALLALAVVGVRPEPFERLHLQPSRVDAELTGSGVMAGGDPDSDRRPAGEFASLFARLQYPLARPFDRSDVLLASYPPGALPPSGTLLNGWTEMTETEPPRLVVSARLAVPKETTVGSWIRRAGVRRELDPLYVRVLPASDSPSAHRVASNVWFVRLDSVAAGLRAEWHAGMEERIAACGEDAAQRERLEGWRREIDVQWQALREAANSR